MRQRVCRPVLVRVRVLLLLRMLRVRRCQGYTLSSHCLTRVLLMRCLDLVRCLGMLLATRRHRLHCKRDLWEAHIDTGRVAAHLPR